MDKEMQTMILDRSIDTCPHCGYTDGFHVSFKVEKNNINIICWKRSQVASRLQ